MFKRKCQRAKIFDSQSVKPIEELVTIPQLFALPLKGSFTVYDAHGLQGSYKFKKLQGANKTSWRRNCHMVMFLVIQI